MFITKEDVKQHIDINTNDYDDILDVYIDAVGAYLKNKIGRAIEEETDITEYFDGDDLSDTVILENYPITDTTTFQFQYMTGTYSSPTWNDFDDDYYQVDTEKGMVLTDAMYDGRRNIKVVYSAGYASADIPDPLKLAALKLVAKAYNKKRSDGFKEESAGGASISWDKFFTEDIAELINPYRKRSI